MGLPSGWLKNAVVQANKPKDSIIGIIKKRVGGYEQARDNSIVHASDITKDNFCPRYWAINDLTAAKSTGMYVNTALRITWDMGGATERLVVEEWGAEGIVGNWKCRRCGDQRTMCGKPPKGCGQHKDCLWEYEQIVIEGESYKVSGSVDALFDVGVPKLLVTEIKTINPKEFDEIVVPLPEHRIRTALYLKLIADSNFPYKEKINLQEGRVLYIGRSHGRMNPQWNEILPFKEFTIPRDDASLKGVLQKATALKIFREETRMPNGICNTAVDKYAKNCSQCKACFSGDFPAQFAWEKL